MRSTAAGKPPSWHRVLRRPACGPCRLPGPDPSLRLPWRGPRGSLRRGAQGETSDGFLRSVDDATIISPAGVPAHIARIRRCGRNRIKQTTKLSGGAAALLRQLLQDQDREIAVRNVATVVKARKLAASSVGTEMDSSGPSTWMSGMGNATSTVTSLSDLLKKR